MPESAQMRSTLPERVSTEDLPQSEINVDFLAKLPARHPRHFQRVKVLPEWLARGIGEGDSSSVSCHIESRSRYMRLKSIDEKLMRIDENVASILPFKNLSQLMKGK